MPNVTGYSDEQVEALEWALDEIPDLAASTIGELDPAGAGEIPAAYVLNDRGDPIPVYGGSLGLGFQAVLGRVVRPYRRVLSAQAIAARETLGAGP